MKTFLTILLLFFSVSLFAQFPITQNLGNANTMVLAQGGLGTKTGLQFTMSFNDTATANLFSPFIKNLQGFLIRVIDTFYVRSNDLARWVRVGSGGGGSITAGYGLSGTTTFIVDTATIFSAYNLKYPQGAPKQIPYFSAGSDHHLTYITPTSLDKMEYDASDNSGVFKFWNAGLLETVISAKAFDFGWGNVTSENAYDSAVVHIGYANAASGFKMINHVGGQGQIYSGYPGNNLISDGLMVRHTGTGGVMIVADGTGAFTAFKRGGFVESGRFANSGHFLINTPTDIGNKSLVVNGSSQFQDSSFIFTRLGSSSDSVLTKGPNGGTRAVAQSSIVGATPIWESTLTAQGATAFTGNHTVDIGNFNFNLNNISNSSFNATDGTSTNEIDIHKTTAIVQMISQDATLSGVSAYIGTHWNSGNAFGEVSTLPNNVANTGNLFRVYKDSTAFSGQKIAANIALSTFSGQMVIGATSSGYKFDVQGNAAGLFAANITNLSSTGAGLGVNTFTTGSNPILQLLSGASGATARFEVRGDGEVRFNNLPGTSGQVLTSAGAAAPPTWQTPTTGTVTSVSAGFGMNFTTITSSGSVIADSSVLVTKSTQQVISASKIFTGTTENFLLPTTTATTTTSGINIAGNSITSGTGIFATTSSLTSGNVLQITGTSTALAANNELVDIAMSGANGTSAITATGMRIGVTNTNGTSGTNVGLSLSASGATTDNFALDVTGGDVRVRSNITSINSAFIAVFGASNADTRTVFESSNSAGAAVLFSNASNLGTGFYMGALTNDLVFVNISAVQAGRWTNAGSLIIGSATTASGRLTLPAGAAGAGNAPIFFTSGTNLTSDVAGAMEYDGTELYFANSTTTRGTIEVMRGSTSAAGTLTLAYTQTDYVFTGTTSTWTLPAVVASYNHAFYLKNSGSGTVTINSSGGGNDIYSSSAVNTYALTAGSSIMLRLVGSIFYVE